MPASRSRLAARRADSRPMVDRSITVVTRRPGALMICSQTPTEMAPLGRLIHRAGGFGAFGQPLARAGDIKADQDVACPDQAVRHRVPHVAEADKPEGPCTWI